MTNAVNGSDKLRAFLVMAATLATIVFNWMAAAGYVGGVTPDVVSDRYFTVITPARFAFQIWPLIYIGLLAFSIYQLLPANIGRFRSVRSLYILACALNCSWIYFWHGGQVGICLGILAALNAVLLIICYRVKEPLTNGEAWLVKGTFGLYCGWVTAALFVNFMALLLFMRVEIPHGTVELIGVSLVILAAAAAVIARLKLQNYLYPLAIAWAATGIGVAQSGRSTAIVVAAALATIAGLIAATSVVMTLNSSISGSK